LAEATNLGLAKMAQACPEYTYRQLAWIADWYGRDETCGQALATIVNAQHRHPFAAHWGAGTTSSSDAQQFPVGGRSAAIGRVNAHYGPEPGVKLYTHLSDQYGPFHSTTISATASEAPYPVDGLLYHETDLEIAAAGHQPTEGPTVQNTRNDGVIRVMMKSLHGTDVTYLEVFDVAGAGRARSNSGQLAQLDSETADRALKRGTGDRGLR
jgi:hypothetical protein